MKIIRAAGRPFAVYFNCYIETGERSQLEMGERILYDDGNVIIGPLKIVGEETHRIVVTADDDYTIYRRIEADEAELNELDPIFSLDYAPVTSSIFLDGFLSAAYVDEDQIFRIDISPQFQATKTYYSELMDENGIEFRTTEEGFIILDPSVIEEIFDRQRANMPPKYIVGYLISFMAGARIRNNRHPRYERYMFTLIPGAEEYYQEMAPRGAFYNYLGAATAVFSLFGSFEPLARYIDSVAVDKEEPVFTESIHLDWVFREAAPKMVVKSFSLTGRNPRPQGTEGSVSYWRLTLNEKGEIRDADVAIDTGNSEIGRKCDYLVRFKDRAAVIYEITEDGRMVSPINLLFHPAFCYSTELREYLQIVFNRM